MSRKTSVLIYKSIAQNQKIQLSPRLEEKEVTKLREVDAVKPTVEELNTKK